MPETRVPVEEMQSQFDEWIRRVEEGEQLVLTRGEQDRTYANSYQQVIPHPDAGSSSGW